NEPISRPAEAVVYRERRLPVGWPQIGKDDAVVLVGRISPVIEPILEGALRRLAGCLEDRPVRREQPSVIAAAYPFGVDQPELQRRAPMRAVQFEQTHRTALIAEDYEILSQDLDPMRQVPQLVGEADRLPEAAEIFAARRARSDMGEFDILLGDFAVVIGAKSRL